MNYSKISVIIVAGGSGTRMGAEIPKQFLSLDGRPMLMRTMETFRYAFPSAEIVVALPKDNIGLWRSLCRDYGFGVGHRTVEGGVTRFHSVKNAVNSLDEKTEIVLVHDGVRPLVSVELARKVASAVPESGAVVPLVPLVDSLRKRSGETTLAVDRSLFAAVQTPQGFSYELLAEAYGQEYRDSFTDDASVVESCGSKIYSVEGDRCNIKITSPVDLAVAEVLLRREDRTGGKNKK